MAYLSQQLSVLRRAGLVSERKEGLYVGLARPRRRHIAGGGAGRGTACRRAGGAIHRLLIAGVFGVGVIRQLIRPEWIESLAGANTLPGNAAGVVFGVFMYFPTLVEVPIANMFLGLGMHRGPLLAYMIRIKVLGPGCSNCRNSPI